ncbi:MAG TPA: hypothetical protein VGH33_27570 [Isosphaeraceae bacterium]
MAARRDPAVPGDGEPRYLTQPPLADRDAYAPASVILTRLCSECIHIIGVMGDDKIRELPEDE